MSTTPVRPTRSEVRKEAEELKTKILARFPDVDVEYADWEDLNGANHVYWVNRGFPPIQYGVHACILVQGGSESSEDAASLADGEVARLLEETNVVIQVQRTGHVYCKQSQGIQVHTYNPGQALQLTRSYSRTDPRGIIFLCLFSEPHEHQWGRLSPEDL